MDWDKGYNSTIYASFINPETWADVQRFEVTGGSIQKNNDVLMESASIDCTDYQTFDEAWVRVWLDADQNGDAAHEPLFTGLAMNPSRKFKSINESNTLTCYSVLKPVDDVLLPRGWFINRGANVKEHIIELLKPTKAPIIFDYDPPWLTDNIIAEDSETNLSMIHQIIDAIKWRIRIDGYGRINVEPKPIDEKGEIRTISASFGTNTNDVFELNVSIENDWFECPNVYRVISNNMMAIARDDDPYSQYSTVSRGREIWKEEVDVVLDSKEALADYAERRLKEAQQTTYKASYTRRFDPNVSVGDIVRINYPQIDLSGYFKINSQTINIKPGATTSEESYMVK